MTLDEAWRDKHGLSYHCPAPISDGTEVKETMKAKPPTGTREWATRNVNIQTGCEHNCRYCCAKAMAIRFGRATAESWAHPQIDMRKVNRRYRERKGRVMFPSAHDITLSNIEESLTVLRNLLAAGNQVLIVSKPYPGVVRHLCYELREYRSPILFRFTIGSADNDILRFWEPFAPSYEERLESLMWAYGHGFRTSVSCEPLLDAEVDDLVAELKSCTTDTIWLGRANRLRQNLATNCPGDEDARRRAEKLLDLHSDEWVRSLYEQYRRDKMIRWKDSIRKVVGLKPERKRA